MKLDKVLTSAVLTAALTFVAFAAAAPQSTKTLTGTVTDQACGAEHKMKNMSAADCARACAKKAGWALVVGDKVYKLTGDDADLNKYAAEMVTVKGSLNGDTMAVTSVTPKKS
jgi:type 1 fimbria pilin